MSLTIFLAICILGCDVLIYFLYEWAFGESKRIRKQRAARLRGSGAAGTEAHQPWGEGNRPGGRPVIAMDPRTRKPAASARVSAHEERLAYRRLATSFAQVKTRG